MIKNLFSTTQIKEIENDFAKENDLFLLMQEAGKHVFEICIKDTFLKINKNSKILIVTGKGNNAGDGLIAALFFQANGYDVTVSMLENPLDFSPNTMKAYDFAQNNNLSFRHFSEINIAEFDLVIDAIFGTGFHAPLSERYAQIFAKINDQAKKIVAIDVPSGLEADTGFVDKIAIKADFLITFIAAKPGFFTSFAKNFINKIIVDRLNLSTNLPPKAIISYLEDFPHFLLDHRLNKPVSQKSDFGNLLVIGGDYGLFGAIKLVAESALQIGAAIVRVITHEENINNIITTRPEIMAISYERLAKHDLLNYLNISDVITIGNGLGLNKFGEKLFSQTIKFCQQKEKTLVIDGDGLTWLAKLKKIPRIKNLVLTPHYKEAMRLLNLKNVNEVYKDPFAIAQKIHEKYGAICVLKGAGTVICDQNGKFTICPYGNPFMAVAGMGDFLCGIISGLLAQKIEINTAIVLGTLFHSSRSDESLKQKKSFLPYNLITNLNYNF